MKTSWVALSFLASFTAAKCARAVIDTTAKKARASDLDELEALITQLHNLNVASVAAGHSSTCTPDKLVVRKPWGSLSNTERKSYTDAVLCLQSKPTKTPSSLVPGARTRYDDWVATHINQTLTIHYTGTFLSWHRWFLYTYEQALRDECGYTGAQPYWNWALYADDPASSPIFDGSDYSMSGNGEFVPNRGALELTLPPYDPIELPTGTGGGCVTSGPFKNMTVNLGPVALTSSNGSTVAGENGGLAYNPRCLKRDITAAINSKYANATSVQDLLLSHDNIADFQLNMQGVPGSGSIGVHGGGHYTLGGDPADDVYVSPGEPVFYLHHGMIDLVWTIWQNLDLATRQKAISGTGTFLDQPPSANITLDTVISLDYTDSRQFKVGELMDNLDGPFCYTYSL